MLNVENQTPSPQSSPLYGKHIVLGISGSIAAYKACNLVRLFVKAGAEVQVVITPSGKEFVTPVTLSALTSRPVVSEFFASGDGTWHSHVEIGRRADIMVIAPATASTLGKMAGGVADNMLITTYLSMKAPVYIAPAMDLDMYAHASTQSNLETLRKHGCTIIEPASGELASHLVGKGRMEEPENIFRIIENHFRPAGRLAGKRILITAGPTYERIDPVRFIGNFSTGKMGYALAAVCAREGAEVELVSGPVSLPLPHPAVKRTDVESAAEMYAAATEIFPGADAAILCAAVADFTPRHRADEKLKREGDDLVLHLQPTHDIAAALGAMKRDGQKLVGFALETTDELQNAEQKLRRKNLDFIVLNSLREEGAGFGVDTNKVYILSPEGRKDYPLKSKQDVAQDIIDELCALL